MASSKEINQLDYLNIFDFILASLSHSVQKLIDRISDSNNP